MAIELISKVKPKNNGSFSLVDAVDVEMPDGKRLSELPPLIPVTQAEYDALEKAGQIREGAWYAIKREKK